MIINLFTKEVIEIEEPKQEVFKPKPAKSRVFDKYMKIIKSGTFTENEIIYFRKALGSSSNLDQDLKDLLLLKFRSKGYFTITKDQSDKGLQWLQNYTWTRSGKPRRSKAMVFGEREQDILKNFKKFMFVDVYNASQNSYKFYLPVYRVYSKSGEYFDYTTNMGNIEVL